MEPATPLAHCPAGFRFGPSAWTIFRSGRMYANVLPRGLRNYSSTCREAFATIPEGRACPHPTRQGRACPRKLRQAFEELQKALAFDRSNIDALYYLSLVSRELSQREYQRLLALAPDSARVHQLLGEAALAAGDVTEAEGEFQKALKANPHFAEVSTELAEMKRSQSKFDEAISYYLDAEKSGTPNYDIAYGLGACYTYKQEYPQAIEWLRKAVDLAPDSAAGRFALGNALFQDGQLEAAIPELNAALRLEPRMKQGYFLLGRAYSKLGRQEEAKGAIKKLDELNRADVPGREKGSSADAMRKPEQNDLR